VGSATEFAFGRTYWPTSDFSNFPFEDFTGFGQIDHTTVVGYGQNGVYIDAPGTHVTVENSTITGPRVFPYFGMNGIQWSRGATGGIHNNTISGNAVQGSVVDDGVGIYLFGGCGQPLAEILFADDLHHPFPQVSKLFVERHAFF